MQLTQITVRDLAVPGSRTLDLTALPRGVVALVGPNGAGKSTLLEASVLGALYRQLPSRSPGGLIDVAVSGQARVDARYHDGRHAWRFLHRLDGPRRRAEAHLYCDGVPASDGDLTSTGKLRVFDALVRGRWPSQPVIQATRCWVQRGVGAWAALPTPQRREVLRELLGLDRLAAIHAIASATLVTAREGVAAAEAASRVAAQHVTAAVELRGQLAALDVEGVRAAATAAQQEATVAAAAVDRYHWHAEGDRAREGEATRARLEGYLADLAGRRQAAAAALPRLEAELRALEVAAAQAEEDQRQRTLAIGAARYAQEAVARLQAALDRAPPAAPVDLDAPGRATALGQLLNRLEEGARAQQRLDTVPCHGAGPYAGCPLIRAAQERACRTTPAEIAQVRRDADAAKRALDAAERAHDANARRAALEEDLTRAQAAAAGARIPPEDPTWTETRTAWQRTRDQVLRGRADLRALHDQERQYGEALARLPGIAAEVASRPPWTGPALDALTQARTLAQSRARAAGDAAARAAGHAARLEAQLAALGDVAAAHATAMSAWDSATARAAALARVRHAFGPRGIPAVLIEHAGPRISELATALLDAAVGPRWGVELRTLRPTQAGGARDVAEVVVHDHQRGWSGVLENASGGEVDLLGSALALAIAQHHAEVAGVRWGTLWIDEGGAALTRAHAAAWVAMVRQAAQQQGIAQVLLVTHDEEVQLAADTLVRIEDLT